MNNYIINLDCLKITNNVNLDKFKNKSVLVLGANGLLGGYLIAVLNFANEYYQLNCKIICCSKNKPKGTLKNIIGNNKEILFLKRDLTIKKKSFFVIATHPIVGLYFLSVICKKIALPFRLIIGL